MTDRGRLQQAWGNPLGVPQTFSLSISERSTHLSRSRRLPHMSTAPAAPIVSLEHVRSHRGLPTAAIVGTSLWVGSAALVCGLLLLRRQSTRGPPHPFTSALVSGLLIGTSCLVVLPEALDSLPAAGWTSSQVLLLFLSSAALMFFLDHAVMEHQHVGPGERLPLETTKAFPLETVKAFPLEMAGESLSSPPRSEAAARLDPAVKSPKARDMQSTTAGSKPTSTAAPPAAKLLLRGSAEGEETGSDSSSEFDVEKPQSCVEQAMAQHDELPTPQPHAPAAAWCPPVLTRFAVPQPYRTYRVRVPASCGILYVLCAVRAPYDQPRAYGDTYVTPQVSVPRLRRRSVRCAGRLQLQPDAPLQSQGVRRRPQPAGGAGLS